MLAINILNIISKGVCNIYCNTNLLFTILRDIRNVIKFIIKGLLNKYNNKCILVINDINFIVVACNAILLFVALSLKPEKVIAIIIHV
jgi:hypothetical protein